MILLDTHVLVWMNSSAGKLSRLAASAIRRARQSGGLAISAVTLLELARLVASNRVQPRGTIQETIEMLTAGILILPITSEIAASTTYLPSDFPGDPIDRTIAATARAEGLALVTADERILNCPLVKTIW